MKDHLYKEERAHFFKNTRNRANISPTITAPPTKSQGVRSLVITAIN